MKKYFILLLSLALVLSLAACGGSSNTNTGEVIVLDALPSEDITISFWHVYGKEKEALLLDYIAEFEALYPNVTVEAETQGGYDDLRTKTVLAISAGNTPTLLVGYPDHVAGYLNGNAVVPLDKFIADETFGVDLTDFVDSYVAENNQYEGGLMYSLPYSKSTEMLVFNKTNFDALGITVPTDRPLTFTELETYATTMVGSGPNQCEYLINYDSAANLFINNVRMWDGGYTNSAGEILVDDAKTLAMVNQMKTYFDNKTVSLPIAWNQDYGSTKFKEEAACMTVGSTAGISYNIPKDGFEIGVAPIPQWDDAHKSAVQQGPNIAIMSNSTDAERLAAWLFIKYITDAEQTAKWSMLTGYLPVRYSGYDSAAYQAFLTDPDPDFKYESMTANAAYLQLSYNQYDPAFAGRITSSAARLQAEVALESVFTEAATPAEALDEMMNQLGAN